jgi:DNA invertase Pin-like site-specific DNA recombinase
MSRLIPAAAYLRRSSDSESQQTSIADQRSAVTTYAAERGYTIVRWYTDDGISGDDTANRLDFQRMMADARTLGDFRAILVWDQERFGRFSPHEASYWTWPLAQADIHLVTVDKGPVDWSDFTEWLTYSVNQHGKHQYLRDLSRNVTKGQLSAVKAGSYVGPAPYAYVLEGPRKHKRLALGEPAHVRVVRRIFHEYVELGRFMMGIANGLNADGIPSPGGRVGAWRFDTVKVILANPAYAGDYAGGKYAHGKYHSQGNGTVAAGGKRRTKDRSEWVIIPDHHEPIVGRATWERAQERLAKGKGTGRGPYDPTENPFLLSRLLRCGKCGCPLHGMRGGNGKTQDRARYYECCSRKWHGKDACEGTTVREDVVLDSIARHLSWEFGTLPCDVVGREMLWEDEAGVVEGIVKRPTPQALEKVRQLIAPPQQPAVDRKRLEKEKAQLVEKIGKARGNVVLLDPANIPAAQGTIRALEVELAAVEAELRKRPPTEKQIDDEAKELLDALLGIAAAFRTAAKEGLTPERRAELRPLLQKIVGIDVHTTVAGQGTRRRHVFSHGEITFRPVGPATGDSNPHAAG